MRGLMRRDCLKGLAAFSGGGVLWTLGAASIFRPSLPQPEGPVPAHVLALAEARVWPWEGGDRAEIELAHAQSAEWDLMARLFLCFSLGDLVLRESDQRERWLRVWDTVLTDTIRKVSEEGENTFLLPYVNRAPFQIQPQLSLFVSGELALMLGLRRLFDGSDKWAGEHRRRIGQIAARLEQGPLLCAESYPDECWMFCNSVAVAALKVADRVDGTNHADFVGRWVKVVQDKLTDPETGLLIGSFTLDGRRIDGVEGSSLWMTTHQLRLVDPEFAKAQYEGARAALGRSLLGFGYALEWPESQKGREDIDSGPVVPGLEASTSSSGLAILAAASFSDERWLGELLAALEFAAIPEETEGRRRYKASNLMGDSVLLAGLTCGPLWRLAGAEEVG